MASSPRIEELRKKFEENPRRYFAPLANEYRKAGDVQQAIAICREYLPQQPGHMSGHIVFGQALYEARTFDEAKAVFETALSLDPENLIALRHLGDISLITGDTDGAKTWYKRVLEADPRNEEIQAQLATIESAAASAPTPAITPAVRQESAAPPAAAAPTPPAGAKSTPSPTAATVVMKAVQPPGRTPLATPAKVTATSPTAEINVPVAPAAPAAPTADEKPVEPTLEVPVLGTAMAGAADAPAVASPLEGLEGSAAPGGDAPITSFSLEGLETTSLSGESAPPPPPLADLDFGPAGAPPPPPPPAPAAATIDLDFGPPPASPAAPAGADTTVPDLDFVSPPTPTPAPPAATTAAPEIALDADSPALDLDLGSLSTPPAPTPTAPPAAPAPPATVADEAPLDLEISLPATPAPAPVVAAVPEPTPIPAAAPAVASAPMLDEEPAVPPTPSGPFVTETMADLYLQQGHREEALHVYRTLLQQRPGDAGLQGKVARLEHELSAPASTPVHGAGPSIRELLLAIAERRPGHRPHWPGTNGVAPTAPPAAPSRMPDPQGPPADARPDALGPALGFAAPAAGDETAAHLLARAFRRNGHANDAPLIAGAPARPANDELSLRSVFKSAEPAPAPSSFSFDQFFSQRASAELPPPHPAEGQAAESPEEVAQFTQWLEGLKKR